MKYCMQNPYYSTCTENRLHRQAFTIAIFLIPHSKPTYKRDSVITPLGINATGPSHCLIQQLKASLGALGFRTCVIQLNVILFFL